MVSFFLSRVALAVGFRQHWVSSLLVGILGLGSLAGKGDPLAPQQGWAAPGLDPQELQGFEISWAPYCLSRSPSKATSSPRRWHCPVLGIWSCCRWPLLNSPHPSLPPLEARLPRVKRQPLHSKTSVPSCFLPGEWIAGRCRAGSVAQGHLPFVSLHFVLS